MKFTHALRQIWHGIYYAIAPESAQEYALTCKEAVTEMNTKKVSSFRVRLHVSLCQSCSNYEGYSRWLRANFPETKPGKPLDLSKKIFAKIEENDR